MSETDTISQELHKALSELGVIDQFELDKAFRESQKLGITLQKYLLDKDMITDANLGTVVAELYNLRYVNLSNTPIDYSILEQIPETVARSYGIIAYAKDDNKICVATSEPISIKAKTLLEKKFALPLTVHFATKRDIASTFALYTREFQSTFDDLIATNVKKLAQNAAAEQPIIEIVDSIIEFAFQNKASDIHIEPFPEQSIVRYRIDGILHDITVLPITLHDQMVLRIKVMASLRIDEHNSTQDGKIQFDRKVIGENEDEVDLRVSIAPITDGEKIVMRILSESSRQFALKDLGFSNKEAEKLKSVFEKPYGMILATGPTGSGKTTTLYAILKMLNSRDVNITTIEDPVEYDIEGINQIQVNEQTGITFSKGLRSIVRQDPDIILVGEIRDEETADIAVNSSLTGHLVLSTLHTNDAATSLPRLLDMNIEPFLVSSTVSVIVAQRLVRKLCNNCRFSVETPISEIDIVSDKVKEKYFGTDAKVRLYDGKGCDVCHHSKFQGRIGVFEVLLVSEAIKEAVVAQADSTSIMKIAIDEGMTTLFEDGLEKVKSGLTTLEEVLRVTKQ